MNSTTQGISNLDESAANPSHSPNTMRRVNAAKKNEKMNFLSSIRSALAPDPQNATGTEGRNQNPSFTIPYPNNRDSWLGSFGMGRRSTENVFAGMKQSFQAEQSATNVIQQDQ